MAAKGASGDLGAPQARVLLLIAASGSSPASGDDPAPMEQPITVHGPRALVAVLPHLLGFRPSASVVLVMLSHRNRVIALSRTDWPPDRDHLQQVLRTLTSSARDTVSGCVVLAYPPPEGELNPVTVPSRETIALQRALDSSGVTLLDLLVVSQGGDTSREQTRWRSLLCTDDRCCPLAGTLLDPRDVDAAQAALIATGSAVAVSRDVIAQAFRSREDPQAEVFRAQLADAPPCPIDPGEVVGALVADIAGPSGAIVDPAVLPTWAPGLAHGLRSVPIRDEIIARLVRAIAGWDAERSRGLVERLRSLVQVAPESLVAPIGVLCALIAWLNGDGVRANLAVARALEVEGDHTLALLVSQGLERGVPPWLVRDAVLRGEEVAA